MAVVRPLTIVDRHTFREVNASSELFSIHQRIAYLYVNQGAGPSVALSVVSSGGNITPNMTDEYYFSGLSEDNSDTAFTNPSSQVQLQQVTYDKISETVTSSTKPTYNIKPVKVDGISGVREMTETDIMDTFIDPVVDLMVSGTTDVRAAGTYHISTSNSLSNHTNLGEVFRNTISDPSSYTASFGLGSRQTDITHTSYYLQRNNGVNAAYTRPLVIDGTDGLREMTNTEFGTYFDALIKAAVAGISGYTLNFNIDGSGTTKGTTMVDTRRTGSTRNDYLADPGDADPNDYRTQMWPSGAAQTRQSYALKVNRT